MNNFTTTPNSAVLALLWEQNQLAKRVAADPSNAGLLDDLGHLSHRIEHAMATQVVADAVELRASERSYTAPKPHQTERFAEVLARDPEAWEAFKLLVNLQREALCEDTYN